MQNDEFASLNVIVGMTSLRTLHKMIECPSPTYFCSFHVCFLGEGVLLVSLAVFLLESEWLRPVRKTLHDSCFLPKTFSDLGIDSPDEEAKEIADYHSRLLTAHVGTSLELKDAYGQFPWRWAAVLLARNAPAVFAQAKLEWKFVTQCVDKLDPTSREAKQFSHTRWQPYRELMVKAEPLSESSKFRHNFIDIYICHVLYKY